MQDTLTANISPPSTFISYSHDSPGHMDRILRLANRLRAEGVPCELDQFHDSPAQGWPRWMMDQIEESSHVLVCCTENYNLRFRGKTQAGTGKGVKWEGAVIAQELYDAGSLNRAFIPVILNPEDAQHIPMPLRGATFYDLSQKDGFTNLLRRLTSQPRVVADPVAASVIRIHNYKAELDDGQLDKEITTDISYYQAKLASWPAFTSVGQEVIEALETLLEKVESRREYREAYRAIWAMAYRLIGGAYLVHAKLDMDDRLRAALPYLRQSHEVWDSQKNFAANIAFLEAFLSNHGGDIRAYLTTILQILRGPADPQIPWLVDQLTEAAYSPELKAQRWLLKEATPSPISGYLEAVKVMIKKERNIDTEIETSSKVMPDGRIEVQVQIGPNIFLWKVNFDEKTFEAGNELTQSFMGMIASANK
jgi:hypothetical protein